MEQLALVIAPAFFYGLYLYTRDRYEREPLGRIVKAFGFGFLAIFPVLVARHLFLDPLGEELFGGASPWVSFVSAGLTEEAAKLGATMLAVYRRPHWNDRFGAVVYAAAAALGFATLENALYMAQFGTAVGIFRAFVSVPVHALFGIIMGYYLGLARARPDRGSHYWRLAWLVPALLHGTFNQLLFAIDRYPMVMLCYLGYICFLWYLAMKKMREADKASPYRFACDAEHTVLSDRRKGESLVDGDESISCRPDDAEDV